MSKDFQSIAFGLLGILIVTDGIVLQVHYPSHELGDLIWSPGFFLLIGAIVCCIAFLLRRGRGNGVAIGFLMLLSWTIIAGLIATRNEPDKPLPRDLSLLRYATGASVVLCWVSMTIHYVVKFHSRNKTNDRSSLLRESSSEP